MAEDSLVPAVASGACRDDDEYDLFLAQVQAHFARVVDAHGNHLFTTDAQGLFAAFLAALPADVRQEYNCSTCRRFIDSFGGLVAITAAGGLVSALWDASRTPALYRDSVAALERLVAKAAVTGIFLTSQELWGKPVTGAWEHLAVRPPAALVCTPTLKTAAQLAAEKGEDFRTLQRGLQDFPLPVVKRAVTLLRSEALYRSEACLGVAEWLQELHQQGSRAKSKPAQTHLLWRAVATAPTGYCHVRSSMIGTLLEDIAADLPFETIKQRFADKMHPLQYQRPQAAPTAGNIAQAEKILAQLGAAGALERRFARLDEIQTLWRPQAPKGRQAAAGGLFSHLRAKRVTPPLVMPAVTMTRSEERRVGKECRRLCRSRWSPYH
jgi:hypothetical protein